MFNVRSKFARHCLWICLCALAPFQVATAKGPVPTATRTVDGFNVAQVPGSVAGSVLAVTGGGIGVNGNVALAVTAGAVAQAAVTGSIAGLAVGGAWGAAAYGLGGAALAVLPAIVDMMARAKARVKTDGTYEIQDATVCTVGPCYNYSAAVMGYAAAVRSTPFAACQGAAANASASDPSFNVTCTSATINQGNYTTYRKSNGTFFNNQTASIFQYSVAPSPASYTPATLAQVQSAISANAPTVAEVQALYDLNFPPAVTPVSITGPISLPLGFNVVKLGIDGTTTTTEEKATFSYFPTKVDIRKQVTQTVASPARTSTTTSTDSNGVTTTGTVIVPAKTTVTTTVEDKPKDDRSECEQYPNLVGCMEVGDVPVSTPLPNVVKAVSVVSVAFAGGSCPPGISWTVLGTTRSFSYVPICNQLAMLKFLLIAIAGVFAAYILADSFKV